MKKIISMLACALMLALSIGTMCFAQDTTDWTYTDDTVIDFCVYNTWGVKSVEDLVKPTIENMRLVVQVSDYSGDPITVKLYNRESVDWGYYYSEPQVISGDGIYYFDIECTDSYDSENLLTIYLKDVACATTDEDPDGGNGTASGVNCHITMLSFKCNADLTTVPEELSAAETIDIATEDVTATEDTTAAETPAETTTAPAQTAEEPASVNVGLIIGIVAAVVVVAVIVIVVIVSKKKKN